MRALCDALGNPERSFDSLHVVGTNGKTSVTLLCAALLEAGGLRTGACISPHLSLWRERTRIGAHPVAADAFADAVAEVAAAVDRVEGAGEGAADGEGERITQFEAAIAASFVAFRNAGVDLAVVEAGLGGRLDATNVIASRTTALTSVGLDHTDWLGGTVAEIAAEKLAVLEPGSALIAGRLTPTIEALARAHAESLGAAFLVAGEAPADCLPAGLPAYLRRNAGLALGLAATVAPPLRPERAAAAIAGIRLAGRAEWLEGSPPMIADAAHNEEGARALAEALEEIAPRPRVACVSVLADKDAGAFAAALAPALDHVVCTAAEPGAAMGRPGTRALEPTALAAFFERAGVAAEAVPDPAEAISRARRIAADRMGVAICAGSNYLLGQLWTERRDPNYSR